MSRQLKTAASKRPAHRQKNKRRKKQKLSQAPSFFSSSLFREMLCIVCFTAALFLYIGFLFPYSTGFIGLVIHKIIGHFFGGFGLKFLPLFLALTGLSLLITQTYFGTLFFTGALSFVSCLVLITLFDPNAYQSLHFDPLYDGGVFGQLGTYFCFHLFGIYGTATLIIGILSVSAILIFGLSLKKGILSFCGFLDSFFKTLFKNRSYQDLSFAEFLALSIRKIGLALFYKKTHTNPSFLDRKAHDFSPITNTPSPPTPEPSPSPTLSPIEPVTDSKPVSQPDSQPAPSPSTPSFSMPNSLIEPLQKTSFEFPHQSDPPSSSSTKTTRLFKLPPLSLLQSSTKSLKSKKDLQQHSLKMSRILEETLTSFNVKATVVHVTTGPSVTRYELQPGSGVKINKITTLSKDIALKLAAPDIRIEAPIPGKSLIGIEVPNSSIEVITLRDIIEQTSFYQQPAPLLSGMGFTITGDPILMDLAKMPHVLIAGATGSGKSVCINVIILSILMRARPDEVKFLMIDPKKVELSLYDGIPHLLAPVVTDPKQAAATLKKWALIEMERRYECFCQAGVKDISGYNAYVKSENQERLDALQKASSDVTEPPKLLNHLPYIVVIIDELADLMMVASQDVEQTICRLAQMSRATGIHLVIATQRPSVNVVTGLIKANVPARISFYLQSQIDSRTILDMAGAEKLQGKGDMLYAPTGSLKPSRAQGIYVSESEVKSVVSFLKKQGSPDYLDELLDVKAQDIEDDTDSKNSDADPLIQEAKSLIISTQYASTSYLQRKLKIGYNRAARIMDELKESGEIDAFLTDRSKKG